MFLCIALLSGIFTISVFAQDNVEYSGRSYKHYTYVGDSVSWGYGLGSEYDGLTAESVFTRVDGSFTDIVGKTLEAACGTEVVSASCNGARLGDFRMILEKGLGVANPYSYPTDTFGKDSVARYEKLQGGTDYVCGNIAKSDLITVTLGANDIFTAVINVAESFDFIDMSKIQSISGLKSVIDYAAFAVSAAMKQKDMLGDFTNAVKAEIKALKVNQKEVIDDIVKLAPADADILVVGYFVPMDQFRIIKGTDPSFLLELFGSVLTLFNDAYEDIASQYSNVHYVDAPDATIIFEDGTSLTDIISCVMEDKNSLLIGIHPDEEGHKYIAGKVLEALENIKDSADANNSSSNLPMRTITYVAGVIKDSIKTTCNKIKTTLSSIFKK